MEDQPTNWRAVVTVVLLLVLPVLAGVAAARRWPAEDQDFYSTVSQIIATLFIAIAVEFFARERPLWEDVLDQILVLALITISWFGLFGCIRGMFEGGGALTSGFAAAGLMSASVLISLALFARVRAASDVTPSPWIVLIFVFPPILLLVL